MKSLLLLTGGLTLAAGLLFTGQGLGLIRWPPESFMIDQAKWVYSGAGIAAVGLALIIVARR